MELVPEMTLTTETRYVDTIEAELADAIASIDPLNVAFPEPMTTIYLTGASTVESRSAQRHNLGVLAQPGNKVINGVDDGSYALFGADNAFYGLGAKADPTPEQDADAVDTWLRWLVAEVAPRANACLFATVPDVLRWVEVPGTGRQAGRMVRIPIGDAEATLARFGRLARIVRALGLPAALVAQDGLTMDGDDLVAGAERISWDDLDVVFVGGSDAFKLGPEAEAICREAQRRGKWVHIGRVNSRRRLMAVEAYADSVDGTFLAFGPSANWPRLVGWLDELDAKADVPAWHRQEAAA